jgi:2-polyprenyl-6-methoxyphenol hydroxylase-like FAD-dependent oxidoreductase
MHGIVLKRLGHNVRVLEQHPDSVRIDQGAGISSGPQAQEFFEAHDRTGAPYSVSCPGYQILDINSKVKRWIKRPLVMSSWGVLYYRLRANFDGYQSDFCADVPSREAGDGDAIFDTGKKVVSLSYDNKLVTVGFKDTLNDSEDIVQADLVIAADGASSTVRQIMLPGVQRTYSGYVAWRGYVLESALSPESRKILDPRFSAFTCSGGYILWSELFTAKMELY